MTECIMFCVSSALQPAELKRLAEKKARALRKLEVVKERAEYRTNLNKYLEGIEKGYARHYLILCNIEFEEKTMVMCCHCIVI